MISVDKAPVISSVIFKNNYSFTIHAPVLSVKDGGQKHEYHLQLHAIRSINWRAIWYWLRLQDSLEFRAIFIVCAKNCKRFDWDTENKANQVYIHHTMSKKGKVAKRTFQQIEDSFIASYLEKYTSLHEGDNFILRGIISTNRRENSTCESDSLYPACIWTIITAPLIPVEPVPIAVALECSASLPESLCTGEGCKKKITKGCHNK